MLVQFVDLLDHLSPQNFVHFLLLLLFLNVVVYFPQWIDALNRSVELVDRLSEANLLLIIQFLTDVDVLEAWREELLVEAFDVLLGVGHLLFGNVFDDLVP